MILTRIQYFFAMELSGDRLQTGHLNRRSFLIHPAHIRLLCLRELLKSGLRCKVQAEAAEVEQGGMILKVIFAAGAQAAEAAGVGMRLVI